MAGRKARVKAGLRQVHLSNRNGDPFALPAHSSRKWKEIGRNKKIWSRYAIIGRQGRKILLAEFRQEFKGPLCRVPFNLLLRIFPPCSQSFWCQSNLALMLYDLLPLRSFLARWPRWPVKLQKTTWRGQSYWADSLSDVVGLFLLRYFWSHAFSTNLTPFNVLSKSSNAKRLVLRN